MPLPDIKPHEFALDIPGMSHEQFNRLLEDVTINGVLMPIVMFEGCILDGVHRYRAAQMTSQISVPTEEFKGTRWEAYRFVMSANGMRRHLNATQRALAAVQMLKRLEAEEAFKQERLCKDFEEAAKKLVERPDRDDHVIWPPREGFPLGCPEDLKAFARENGVENVAQNFIGDEQEFDNKAALAEVESLIAGGHLDPSELPTDVPDPESQTRRFSADRTADEPTQKRGRGRPRKEPDELNAPLGDFPKVPKKIGRPRKTNAVDIASNADVSIKTARSMALAEADGTPELIEAMHRGEVKAHRAAEIAKLPKAEQAAAIESPKLMHKPKNVRPSLTDVLKMMSDISDTPASFVNDLGPDNSRTLLKSMRCAVVALQAEIGE